jgi:hypothetical protein
MTIKSISVYCATFALTFLSLQTSLQAQSSNHPAAACSGCSLVSPKFKYGAGTTNPYESTYNSGWGIISSPNQAYRLIFTAQGLAVIKTQDNTTIWSVNISGNKGLATLKMQNDGNLVLYSSNNTPLWATDSSNHPESSDGEEKYLMLQDDGNLVIYDWDSMSADDPMWATGTCGGVANGCGTPGAR